MIRSLLVLWKSSNRNIEIKYYCVHSKQSKADSSSSSSNGSRNLRRQNAPQREGGCSAEPTHQRWFKFEFDERVLARQPATWSPSTLSTLSTLLPHGSQISEMVQTTSHHQSTLIDRHFILSAKTTGPSASPRGPLEASCTRRFSNTLESARHPRPRAQRNAPRRRKAPRPSSRCFTWGQTTNTCQILLSRAHGFYETEAENNNHVSLKIGVFSNRRHQYAQRSQCVPWNNEPLICHRPYQPIFVEIA